MAIQFRKAQWIVLGITGLMGILGCIYYLLIIPQNLAILNVEAVVIISPDEGAIYNVNDTVLFTVIFNPGVLEGQATDYLIIASSSDKIFLQEEGISLAYNTAFTITRTFTPDIPTESLKVRVEVTIGSEVYYNELTVTVIDPEMTTDVTTETTTSYDTIAFELPLILLILVVCGIQQRKQYNKRRIDD